MSFALLPRDVSVQAALRRIARSELAAAQSALATGQPPAAAVHGLRKAVKKLRGLMRLVRPVCPDFAAADARLRVIGRRLAPLRDAEVRLATLTALCAGLEQVPPAAARDAMQAEVEARRDPGELEQVVAAVDAEMDALRRQARRWRLAAEGWPALAPGLAATWRDCRRGLRVAARARATGGGSAPLHDWRRAVKRHWYQARLLTPIWPEMLAPHVAEADALGEALGLHNDLDLLLAWLAGHPDRRVASLAQEGPILRAGLARREALAECALARGARLFAEPARGLVRRWGGWWDLRATVAAWPQP